MFRKSFALVHQINGSLGHVSTISTIVWIHIYRLFRIFKDEVVIIRLRFNLLFVKIVIELQYGLLNQGWLIRR